MQRSQAPTDASPAVLAASSSAARAAGDPAHVTPVRTAGLLAAGVTAGALAWALGRLVLELGRRVPLPGDAAGGWIAAGTLRVEDLVGLGAALLGTGLAGWFSLGFLVAALCAATRAAGSAWVVGERLVGRAAPGVVRRALVLSAGTGVALAGTGLPAVALAPPPPDDLGWAVTADRWTVVAPDAPAPAAPAGTPTAAPVAPGPTGAGGGTAGAGPHAGLPAAGAGPDGAAAATPGTPVTRTAAPVAGTPTATTPPETGVVVVRPGDTLWDIAGDHLPQSATVADVASAWPTWYAANTDVIGPDPDLIVPGQRLVAPATPTAGTTDGADR